MLVASPRHVLTSTRLVNRREWRRDRLCRRALVTGGTASSAAACVERRGEGWRVVAAGSRDGTSPAPTPRGRSSNGRPRSSEVSTSSSTRASAGFDAEAIRGRDRGGRGRSFRGNRRKGASSSPRPPHASARERRRSCHGGGRRRVPAVAVVRRPLRSEGRAVDADARARPSAGARGEGLRRRSRPVAIEPDRKSAGRAETVLGRVGSPDDVAEAILYLAGATFVTGTTIVVDGGRCCKPAGPAMRSRVHGYRCEHLASRSPWSTEVVSIRAVPHEEPTDGELIERVGDGDRDAFEALYRRYTRPVLGLALRRLGDRGRAEDAFQEAFAAIWRSASATTRSGAAAVLALHGRAERDRRRRAATARSAGEAARRAVGRGRPGRARRSGLAQLAVHRALERATRARARR